MEHGIYDGIGYVFNSDGLIGIDLDAGFDDGFLSPLAADIISHCESYTEKSISGRGVHILVRGSLPFKGKKQPQRRGDLQEQSVFHHDGKCTYLP